jgi:hypothetical protein
MSWRCPRCGQVQQAPGSNPLGAASCLNCGHGALGRDTPSTERSATAGSNSEAKAPFDLLDLESLDSSELVSLPLPAVLPVLPVRPPVPSGPVPPIFRAPDSRGSGHEHNQETGVADAAGSAEDGCDPLEAVAESALLPLASVESDPLEILDDEALFRSLEVEGYQSTEAREQERAGANAGPATGATPTYSMVSVRCRVCDTLQYVESRPGIANLCDICFTPLPVPGSAAAEALDKKLSANRQAGAAKSHSPEAIGEVAADTSGHQGDDEVAALIRDVEGATGATFVVARTDPAAVPAAESTTRPHPDNRRESMGDELQLAPLDELTSHRSLEHLLLEDETKSLLQRAVRPLEEADEGDLIPLDGDGSAVVLDAVLDEDLTGEAAEPPTNKPPARPPSTPPALAPPIATPQASPAARPATQPRPPQPGSGFDGRSRLPGLVAPESSDRESIERPWWRDLVAPFGSPLLLGVGLLLVLLVYWLQISWRLAWDDGKVWQQVIGYCSGILASMITLPLWLAFLGVIANRQMGLGQAGRLSLPAIVSQTAQFAIVLALAIPGAALGTPAMSSLVSGCLAAMTMLPLGLYFVTSAIVAEEMFCYHEPSVLRSIKQSGADWAQGLVVVGLILTCGIPLAIITSYGAWVGSVVFATYAVPASMVYAAMIGRLADLASGSKD